MRKINKALSVILQTEEIEEIDGEFDLLDIKSLLIPSNPIGLIETEQDLKVYIGFATLDGTFITYWCIVRV